MFDSDQLFPSHGYDTSYSQGSGDKKNLAILDGCWSIENLSIPSRRKAQEASCHKLQRKEWPTKSKWLVFLAIGLWILFEVRAMRKDISELKKDVASARKFLEDQEAALSAMEVWIKPDQKKFHTSSTPLPLPK
jgi:hypothetical protein